jgi:hypothetical protein
MLCAIWRSHETIRGSAYLVRGGSATSAVRPCSGPERQPCRAKSQSAKCARDTIRAGIELLEASHGRLLRGKHRRRYQFQGAYLRLRPGPRNAVVRIRPERQFPAFHRGGPVRVRVRACGARRFAGQHLGSGRRVEHAHQVQPAGASRDADGTQARGARHPRQPSSGDSRAARATLRFQSPHGRHLGCGRRYLRIRRLRQLAGGEI